MAPSQDQNVIGSRSKWVQEWLQWPRSKSVSLDSLAFASPRSTQQELEEWSVMSYDTDAAFDVQSLPDVGVTTFAPASCDVAVAMDHVGRSSSTINLQQTMVSSKQVPQTRQNSKLDELDCMPTPYAEDELCHDIRAQGQVRRRVKDESVKYFNYRYVHRGQLDKEHFPSSVDRKWWSSTDPLPQCHRIHFNKKMLFEDAQKWPRPPKFHRGRSKCRDFARHTERAQRNENIRNQMRPEVFDQGSRIFDESD